MQEPTTPMKRQFLFLLSVLLILPVLVVQWPARAEDGMGAGGQLPSVPLGFDAIASEPLRVLERARRDEVHGQVRIERRIVVRIAPSSDATRVRLLSELPRRPLRTAYEEVEHGNCVAVADIVGVQPVQDDRLLLFTRDRQVLSAVLERSCSARAFYSGFYVERNEDGRLCVSRDQLHSREGTSCQVASFRRLVAVRD